jgi:hypothetical protein
MLAASNNTNPEVILILLKAGADTKVTDNVGQTVLAASKGFTVDKKLDVPDPS